jgi:hypothetical protein
VSLFLPVTGLALHFIRLLFQSLNRDKHNASCLSASESAAPPPLMRSSS